MEIREALEYLVDLGESKYITAEEINGRMYTKDRISRVKENVELETLNINTLSGLVDYIKSDLDGYKDDNILITVETPRKVTVSLEINSDGDRPIVLRSEAIVPHIAFNDYYDTEKFNVLLQSAFLDNEDKALLLQVAGNIKEEAIKTTGDDGVSQVATIKSGVATVQDVVVPNPAKLKPMRTFNEVEQPESKFIFRMKDGPSCALFEADGGAWRNEAMKNIKEYLEKELEGMKGITIIS
ncbi:hypothetical protein [Peptostreptococcus faecalis]|uniref:hypothetical protein n=1 Tax=Peptostreptococcus faecalis TaxID=2045015 RepID=UPI000C7D7FCA|nr:hypothetical protein [Peptostreptococcus faecalis]